MSDASEPELPAPVPEKRNPVTPDLPPVGPGAPDLPGAGGDAPRPDDANDAEGADEEQKADKGAGDGSGRTKAQEPPD
ncbi:hypothetical protein ACFWTC_24830 [Streptomyces sp. NPDC058619]|uniref:hypothetical protein n=1 Tax=Streptomyces sp. NPDC058619 TaxID=3346559 RepID=UPI0036483C7F